MTTDQVRAAMGAIFVLTAGCVSGRTRAGYDRVLRESAALGRPSSPTRALEAAAGELPRLARRQTVLRLVLGRNPELQAALARVRAEAERGRSLGRLPDPLLKYEQGGVPLDRPHALDKAEMVTVGVEQTFPAPGSLDAQSRAALHDTAIAAQAQRGARQSLRARAEQAYADYAGLFATRALQAEHVELASRLLELSQGRYAAGQGDQQQILRAQIEVSRLRRELARTEQAWRAATALLNALMARPSDAPLGPPEALTEELAVLDRGALAQTMQRQRPDLLQGDRSIARSAALLDAAESEADLPAFTVGAGYWLAPHMEQPHAYGAMVSINLPWLSSRHDEQVRAAEYALLADKSARKSAAYAASYELEAALAAYDAARKELAIVDRELVEQASRNAQAAQNAFAAGRLDAPSVLEALRALLEARIERARALSSAHAALADVRRVVGADDEPQDRHGHGGSR